jgi:5-hydroxyisourate hydrolase
MSQVTTHILDTTKGRPAEGITIILFENRSGEWKEISKGVTNQDGRITDLLSPDQSLNRGEYKMRFEIKDYFARNNTATFYPFIDITFLVGGEEHYHIPLLLSPFGYSTYRGS